MVADEQASALAMAIFWRGMAPDELAVWTQAMIDSGERLDLSAITRPTVDKHSTGGVGDKVSLPLIPLAAACGVAVPQLSGRGLGHTGGTLDKMESIPGWRAQLSNEEFLAVLAAEGGVICAAGPGLAPADRRLYALRDITGTVESIPLIASSIMSKKIAEGTDALVLDVKFGSGAFLPDPERGRELARTMVGLGTAHGVRTTALLTAMEQPLGRSGGQRRGGRGVRRGAGRRRARGPGRGDPGPGPGDGGPRRPRRRPRRRAGRRPGHGPLAGHRGRPGRRPRRPPARGRRERHRSSAESDGVVQRLDAMAVGVAAWRLGAGRARKEDAVSATAGVICHAKVGDTVRAGDPVLELRADDPSRFAAAHDALDGAWTIGPDPASPRPSDPGPHHPRLTPQPRSGA